MNKAWVLSYPSSASKDSDRPGRADAQADRSLDLTHSNFVGFVMRLSVVFSQIYSGVPGKPLEHFQGYLNGNNIGKLKYLYAGSQFLVHFTSDDHSQANGFHATWSGKTKSLRL